MTDILYLAITVLFFLSSWGLMKLCDVLDDNTTGGQS
jgi:hypothetical protein